ncbi:uncharacterized protein LOC116960791 isoform X3 [Tyto alba]|uniref:uncharacterized protein LOC116960791 isoform X3 n=1 Tax=Tyto alba TaxID=56313 RepID=UPI001C681B34|nr:uncharacterized protein LOC116960791 isoform X3 [Tyto alba]
MKSNDPISQITVSGRRSECSEKSRGLLAVPGAGPVPAGRGGAAAPEPRVWYSPKGNRAPSGPPSCAQRAAAAASAEIKKDGAAWPSRGCAASLARWRWGTDGGRGAGSDVAMKLLSRRRILVKKVAWSWLGAKDHALKARQQQTLTWRLVNSSCLHLRNRSDLELLGKQRGPKSPRHPLQILGLGKAQVRSYLIPSGLGASYAA